MRHLSPMQALRVVFMINRAIFQLFEKIEIHLTKTGNNKKKIDPSAMLSTGLKTNWHDNKTT